MSLSEILCCNGFANKTSVGTNVNSLISYSYQISSSAEKQLEMSQCIHNCHIQILCAPVTVHVKNKTENSIWKICGYKGGSRFLNCHFKTRGGRFTTSV